MVRMGLLLSEGLLLLGVLYYQPQVFYVTLGDLYFRSLQCNVGLFVGSPGMT